MSVTATTEFRRALSDAKARDLREPLQARSLEAQLQELLTRYRQQRGAKGGSAEAESSFVEMLILLRLAHKLNESPSGLDHKLERLVRKLNRSLR